MTWINFSGQNFVLGADGGRILEEFMSSVFGLKKNSL